MININQGIWAKVAAVAVAGGTAFALFGGGAVHTQFSATANGTGTVSGATVNLALDANNSGTGDFACSDLVPGATPAQPWVTSNGSGYCSESLTIKNTGDANAFFSISYGAPNPGGTTGAIDNATDLSYLDFSYNYPTAAGPFPYYTNGHPTDAYSFGELGPGRQVTVTLTITLAGQAGNEWQGATLEIPLHGHSDRRGHRQVDGQYPLVHDKQRDQLRPLR